MGQSLIIDRTFSGVLAVFANKEVKGQTVADIHHFQVRSASGLPGPPRAPNSSQMLLRCPLPSFKKTLFGVLPWCHLFRALQIPGGNNNSAARGNLGFDFSLDHSRGQLGRIIGKLDNLELFGTIWDPFGTTWDHLGPLVGPLGATWDRACGTLRLRGPAGTQAREAPARDHRASVIGPVPSVPKWSQVVPNGPKWSQMVPNCSKWSQMVSNGPNG
jgi:hypothetical protein